MDIAGLQRQLGIDSSFFWQFAIFFVAYLFLRSVYFSPYLKLIQRREGQSDGLADEAQKLEEEAAGLEAGVQEALSAARKGALGERETVLAKARKEASDSVSVARGKAKQRLDLAREASARSAEAELAALKAQVPGVSALLVEKLTKTKVGL